MANSTAAARQEMLAAIGAKSVAELFAQIPADHRLRRPLDLPPALASEAELCATGTLPDVASLLAIPDVHLHLYGKKPRPGRKLGHVTVWALDEASRDVALARVLVASGVA